MSPLHPSQDAKVLALATSPAQVAAACSSGKVLLFSAANFQPTAALEPPLHLRRGAAAVACSFAAGGAQLVASYQGGSGGGLLATWDISNPLQPALLGATLRACHRWARRAEGMQGGWRQLSSYPLDILGPCLLLSTAARVSLTPSPSLPPPTAHWWPHAGADWSGGVCWLQSTLVDSLAPAVAEIHRSPHCPYLALQPGRQPAAVGSERRRRHRLRIIAGPACGAQLNHLQAGAHGRL